MLFCTWFYLSVQQREKTEHEYMSDVRVVYSLWRREDLTSLASSRELSLSADVYKYWIRSQKNLDESPEPVSHRQTDMNGLLF